MESKLFSRIRTVEERDKLSEEIDVLLKSLYEEKGNGFDSSLRSQVRFWVAEIIRTETGGSWDLVQKYLTELKGEMEKYQVLKLSLAFEPSDISIDKFIDFVRKEEGDRLILDFEYDPRILGGAYITYKGEYRDLSLKRLFEEEYKDKQGDVIKIVYSK